MHQLIGWLIVLLFFYLLIRKLEDWSNEREWRKAREREIEKQAKLWKDIDFDAVYAREAEKQCLAAEKRTKWVDEQDRLRALYPD